MADFKSLDKIINKAASFNSKDRFNDVNEIMAALEKISKRDLFYERIGVNFIKGQYGSLKQNLRSIGRIDQQQVESLLESVFYGEDILKERSENPIPAVEKYSDEYIDVECGSTLKLIPPDKKYRVGINRSMNVSVRLGDTEALDKEYSKFRSEMESDLKYINIFSELKKSIDFLNNTPSNTAAQDIAKQLNFLRSSDVVNYFGNFKVELDIGYYKKIAEFFLNVYKEKNARSNLLKINANLELIGGTSFFPSDFFTKIKSGLDAVKRYNGIYVGDLKDDYIVRLVLNKAVL